jgi:hypothetical protein
MKIIVVSDEDPFCQVSNAMVDAGELNEYSIDTMCSCGRPVRFFSPVYVKEIDKKHFDLVMSKVQQFLDEKGIGTLMIEDLVKSIRKNMKSKIHRVK